MNFYGNQHRKKIILSKDVQRDIWMLLFIVLVVIQFLKPKIISPCPDTGCSVKVVYAIENKKPIQQIIDYIVYKFGPEGDHVVTQALSCFISESHLNPNAYNFNANGTWDFGVAQWNQVHGQTIDEIRDYKKQIDLAYQLYKKQGFSPWYGSGCH